MYCKECGHQIADDSKFCMDCGTSQSIEIVSNLETSNANLPQLIQAIERKREPNVNVNIFSQESGFAPYLRDEPSFGFALLGFLFPYVGLVIYFIIKGEKPLKAGSCIKGVIWSVILSVIVGIMYFTWLDRQYEKIDKQYKIEMQKIEKELERELKKYGY